MMTAKSIKRILKEMKKISIIDEINEWIEAVNDSNENIQIDTYYIDTMQNFLEFACLELEASVVAILRSLNYDIDFDNCAKFSTAAWVKERKTKFWKQFLYDQNAEIVIDREREILYVIHEYAS